MRAWAVGGLIDLALAEDLPAGDVTTEAIVPASVQGRGRFVARAAGILAGTDAVLATMARVDARIRVDFRKADGDGLSVGETFAEANGALRSLLAAERTALNLLQRLSGVATLTRSFVAAVSGTTATIVDTRKTTPGLRALQKAAVLAGGGRNHRSSLSDGVLIKTNHVRIAGGVAGAVMRARASAPHPLRIEIEVRDLAELAEALESGADICLLDNMSVEAMRDAVAFVSGRCKLEASGGIRLDTVRAIAETGVDLISVGALTHSAPALDLAFEIDEPSRAA